MHDKKNHNASLFLLLNIVCDRRRQFLSFLSLFPPPTHTHPRARAHAHTPHLPTAPGLISQPWRYQPRRSALTPSLLPSSSSLTSLAAVRPSSFRFFSMALLRSRAALSSALRVHPMVREHSLIECRYGSTEESAIIRRMNETSIANPFPFLRWFIAPLFSARASIPLRSLCFFLGSR